MENKNAARVTEIDYSPPLLNIWGNVKSVASSLKEPTYMGTNNAVTTERGNREMEAIWPLQITTRRM